MDKLEHYRNIIKKTLTQYHQMSKNVESDVDDLLAFDEEQDQYLWFKWGWNKDQRVRNITMYLRIKNDKIWVEEDLTDYVL